MGSGPPEPARPPDEEGGPEPQLPRIDEAIPDDRRPAEPTLEPGIERRDEFTVEGALVTDVGGTIETSVLSTPGMIAMMERCSSVLAYANLPEGLATVGFEVCVKHVSAALAGTTCAVRSVLTEVVEGRKLRFEVEVTEGSRTIGLGTHERRAIPTNALAQPSGSRGEPGRVATFPHHGVENRPLEVRMGPCCPAARGGVPPAVACLGTDQTWN